VRILSQHGGVEIAEALGERGCGVTGFVGQAREGAGGTVYALLAAATCPSVHEQFRFRDPHALVTVGDPRAIQHGCLFDKRRK
jgi:uncharacterized protein YebE (UPF0316 family)